VLISGEGGAEQGATSNFGRRIRLLNGPATPCETAGATGIDEGEPPAPSHPCPCCAGRMIIIETFERGGAPRYHPTVSIRIAAKFAGN
jgi:hypothetical protein